MTLVTYLNDQSSFIQAHDMPQNEILDEILLIIYKIPTLPTTYIYGYFQDMIDVLHSFLLRPYLERNRIFQIQLLTVG